MLFLLLVLIASSDAFQQSFAASASSEDWRELSTSLGGRLYSALPLASSCFPVVNGKDNDVNATACATVQSGYTRPAFRSPQFSAFMQVSIKAIS